MGCCGLALQTEGQKGRAGEGSSLGNWAGPTSQPEELADDKALGAVFTWALGEGEKQKGERGGGGEECD